MNALIGYMIEANLGIGFFLVVYQAFLKKETDHRFKRAYLLAALTLSASLPFFHFLLPTGFTFDQALETHWLPEIQIGAFTGNAKEMDGSWIYAGYAVGATFFGGAFVARLIKLATIAYHSPRHRD